MAFSVRVSASIIGKIIPEVCVAIWEKLSSIYMRMPADSEDWKVIAKNFESIWNFPHCIGAIDGKHVVIKAPSNSGSLYFNYNGRFSVVLMALVDAAYKFIAIDVGSYGRNSDGGIFSNSSLGKATATKQLHIPDHEPLSSDSSLGPMPYVIVGDEALPLMENLTRPYPSGKKVIAQDQRIFHYRLSRVHRIVENACWLLSSCWRVFHAVLALKPENVTKVVLACCVLHNFLQSTSTPAVIASLTTETVQDVNAQGLQLITRMEIRATRYSAQVRENFTTYFCNEGVVPWQETVVRRGQFTD